MGTSICPLARLNNTQSKYSKISFLIRINKKIHTKANTTHWSKNRVSKISTENKNCQPVQRTPLPILAVNLSQKVQTPLLVEDICVKM